MATVTQSLDPGGAFLFGTGGIPELVKIDGTNFPLFGYAFDAAAAEFLDFRFFAANYGSGNLTLLLDWYSRDGSTTGAVVWSAQIAASTPGDAQSMQTKALAAASTATTTVNGTARGLTRSTITISNLDSLAANDSVELSVSRSGSAGGDTMAGDAILIGITVQYSDT